MRNFTDSPFHRFSVSSDLCLMFYFEKFNTDAAPTVRGLRPSYQLIANRYSPPFCRSPVRGEFIRG
jgi:hypothetical protein